MKTRSPIRRKQSRSQISGRSRASSTTSRHPSLCEDFDRLQGFRRHYNLNKNNHKRFQSSETSNELNKRNF